MHYAISRLGMADWQAREHLRIARQLEALPQMTQAAEHGWLARSKLREVIRVATPEDEGQWLQVCRKFNYHELERLVRGAALPNPNEPVVSELKLSLSPELRLVLSRTLQLASPSEGRVVSSV